MSLLLVNIIESSIPAPDHILFLQLPLEVLQQRIRMRGSVYEKDETYDRAKEMQRAYQEILNYRPKKLRNTIVHYLDGTVSIDKLTRNAYELVLELESACY